jgi:glycerol-3-phosphate dehydrogenase
MTDETAEALGEVDVAIIGAGLIGCGIARALSAFDLRIAVLEARSDVGDGTSKANTAILHTGFDATPGTLESQLVSRGFALWLDYAEATGVPVERTGALLVAWDEEQLATLPKLQQKAKDNGYDSTRIVDSASVYARVPDLGPGALGGLEVPDESIMCSWSAAIAMATEAVERGVTLHLNTALTGITRNAGSSILHTNRGELRARWVINAAGLGGDTIDGMFGFDRFHLNPRKGELVVFDKLARPRVPVIVLPVPSKVGKGVLISPTIYGNVMLGPTAEDLTDRSDTSTSEAGFAFLFSKGAALMPSLMAEEVTASYSGLRAAHDRSDYVIELDAKQQYVVAGCIRSTGLTAALSVGEYVLALLVDAGLPLRQRGDLPPTPRVPNIGERAMRPYQDAERIAADPAYGEIVCFCERVTAGEIRDACNSTIPAADLTGLRRRTRALNGRCQGFFCGAEVRSRLEQLLAEREPQ